MITKRNRYLVTYLNMNMCSLSSEEFFRADQMKASVRKTIRDNPDVVYARIERRSYLGSSAKQYTKYVKAQVINNKRCVDWGDFDV